MVFFVSERESLSHFRMLNKVILRLVHRNTANCCDHLDMPEDSGGSQG